LVETQIELSGHMLRLSIKDNGIGFSIDEVKSKNTLGLIGINERVAMLHGEIILDSRLDEGTHIIITVPLSLSEND
jgi:two-component system sensor histidine kinase DegS